MADDFDIPEDELQVHFDQDAEGRWIVRLFHRPTSSIKISDYFWDKEDALAQVQQELKELLRERRKGLY